MEGRIRRYFLHIRSVSMPHSQQNRPVDKLDLRSVAYESTSRSGKPPIFISQPLRKSGMAKPPKDDLDHLAIRTFPYDSLRAGKPPVMGGRPLKGNGPVKLQTSRRLSSGELLAINSDFDRTLEDLREGEYIVGRKDKRRSQSSQARTVTPALRSPVSPTTLRLPSTGSLVPVSNMHNSPLLSSENVNYPLPRSTVSPPIPQAQVASPLSSPTMNSSRARVHGLAVGTISDDNLSSYFHQEDRFSQQQELRSTRSSLLTRHEEQNATIHALWKAEYARLVAIYGQDGVDRNIAALNQDPRRSSLSEKAMALDTRNVRSPVMLDPLPRPSFDNASMSAPRTTRLSVSSRGYVSAEDVSDYASTRRSSVLSSAEDSSSYTVRTSMFENENHTSREDVRRIVEEMRSTYLQAIEAKAVEQGQGKGQKKKRKKKKTRASYSPTNDPDRYSPPHKMDEAKRQSWHASNLSPAGMRSNKRQVSDSKNEKHSSRTREKEQLLTQYKHEHAVPLQRADSMTLGSLLEAPKLTGISSSNISRQVNPMNKYRPGEYSTARDLTTPTQWPEQSHYVSTISTNTFDPNIAPEIDDFDIFYQDLYGPPPAPGTLPSVPAINRYTTDARAFNETAPPPPDIQVGPRKRFIGAVF